MTEYAPSAIFGLFATIRESIPQAINGGIQGDAAHTYGYHRGRNYVSSGDYSVQLADDKAGDGEACSALDISWSQAPPHYTVSQRLLNAKNDARMNPCREFYGSVDGIRVCGWDYAYNYAVTSDSSHLWHVHLSILRKYANNAAALDGIAKVIIGASGGGTPTPPAEEEDPMSKDFIVRDGSNRYWCIAADFSSRTELTVAVYNNLAKNANWTGNPGFDQTTLVRIPDVTKR